MEQLTRQELKTLMEKQDDQLVSIYLPTKRAGQETRKNPIRFKNRVQQAEAELEELGMTDLEAKEYLKPAYKLVDDFEFWQHQRDGLAAFLDSEGFRRYRMPYSFNELTVVADRYHIKPLLPVVTSDHEFYILALSQNDVRFLRGRRFSIERVQVNDLPRNLEDALGGERFERSLQFHTRAQPTGGATRAGQFHGHGVSKDFDKDQYLRYCRVIDEALRSVLRDKSDPLLVAAVEYVVPLFREASTYQHIVEDGITGNPEDVRDEELHSRAWRILEPRFVGSRRLDMERFRELSTKGQGSSELKDVVRSACEGRIDTLFVAEDVQKWGTCDLESFTVEVHEKRQNDDDDLLDLAAVHTLEKGGTVHVVPVGDVPADSPVAAIYRY